MKQMKMFYLMRYTAKELESVDSNIIVFGMGPGLVKTKRTLVEAQSHEGIRWNPDTKKQFELGNDRPPQDCAKATIKVLASFGKEMNGKIFSTADII